MAQRVVVRGYREFLRACNRADKDTKRYVTSALAGAGESVRSDAAAFFTTVSGGEKTAAGFKSRARVKGVAVYQSKRKVTGKHPEYGAFQMKVLHKSVARNINRIERDLERALDLVSDRFERI